MKTEKIIVWLMDVFIPRLGLIALYVGFLVLIFLLANLFEKLLGLEVGAGFCGILVLSFVTYHYIKDLRLENRIQDLIKYQNPEDLKEIITDGNVINYSAIDGLCTKITRTLKEEGFEDSAGNKGEIYQKTKKLFLKKVRLMRN